MKQSRLLFRLLALVAAMMCALGASAAEAYANWTPSDTTLTFYYDNLRSSRTGTTYDLNTGYSKPEWYNDILHFSARRVSRVVFDSSFATARPTSTYYWFYGMINLETITGIEYLHTEDVTKMDYMFYYCKSLTSLDLSNFNTANVTDMAMMFYYCKSLTSLDLSNFNTANVTDMGMMFSDCSGLTSLDLSSFNTANLTMMIKMFQNCGKLQTIYVGNGWSTAAVTYSSEMFLDCTSLVGGQGTTYDANHVNKAYAHIDGGPSNPGYFTEFKEPYACYTSSNTTLAFYYDGQRNSRPGTTYDLNTGSNNPGWYTDGTYANVTKVVFDPSFADARPTTISKWFQYMSNLQSITGMDYLNTVEVTDMSWSFYECNALGSVDVSHFNTASVTDMTCMFSMCESLTNLDVSNFNTSQVENMYGLFTNCKNLTSLDVSHFNTANVTDMDMMFYGCSGLSSLDVSSFNTSKVTNMYGVFYGCTGLTSLDLSSFSTAMVTDFRLMFSGCSNLTTIYAVGDWNAAKANGKNMFKNCTSLVGGKGTVYDAGNVGLAYAQIDGGPSNPGYFSEKPAGMRGDVNGDTNVDIIDATMLINYLLSGNASGMNLDNANCDLQGGVDITDATTLINYLLNGAW